MSQASSVPGFTRRHLYMVLGTLMAATFLASMEISIINTATPTIVGEFGAFESFAWIGTAYIATAAIGTPLWGKLSDLIGRRPVFLTTLAVFMFGSLLCGVATSMNQLIAFRAVQGLGGGALQALAFAVLGDILPPRERGRYIGYFTLTFAGAAFVGPVLGGLIIDHWSWRWIFFINVPFGALGGAAAWNSLKLPFPTRRARLDVAGAALLSLGVGSLLVALELGQSGWTQPRVVALLTVAVASTLLFIGAEFRAPEPIIPPRLLADRAVVTATLLGVWASVIAFGAAPYLPLYFQDSTFASPTESGLLVLPVMVGVVIGSFIFGRLISRVGKCRPWPILGSVIALFGLAAIAQLTATTPYLSIGVPLFGVGFGLGAMFTTSSIIAQNAVEIYIN